MGSVSTFGDTLQSVWISRGCVFSPLGFIKGRIFLSWILTRTTPVVSHYFHASVEFDNTNPHREVNGGSHFSVRIKRALCPHLTGWRDFGKRRKSMRSHLEPFSWQKRTRKTNRDNWDLNDVSTRSLNWMWKGHHYIQLPNGKHLFFSESNQANTQGGLCLISQVDSNGNIKSVTILVVWYICHGG